jgi:hypothetical protein
MEIAKCRERRRLSQPIPGRVEGECRATGMSHIFGVEERVGTGWKRASGDKGSKWGQVNKNEWGQVNNKNEWGQVNNADVNQEEQVGTGK